MNELIKINNNENRITVSARELHEGLEITERFSNWFERMKKYGFAEQEDFVGCKVFNALARQDLQDYQITIDMAKQICMIQRSDRGKEYRRYFLEIEKQWNEPQYVMARAIKFADGEIKKLENDKRELSIRVEEMRPKEIFSDAVAASHTSILVGDLAKILKQNKVDIGANRLFIWLRENGYLIKRKGTDYNLPTQKSMELKLFEIKETVVAHADGHTTINKTPKVTGKGQQYFINKFLSKELIYG